MSIRDELIEMMEAAKTAAVSATEASHLYADLGLDSLSFMRLLVRIEQTYSIAFELLEMEPCLQAGRLIALVESKVKEFGHDSPLIDRSGRPG